ncbi:potassium channel family protein [Megalodesulfovibrio paquesii]
MHLTRLHFFGAVFLCTLLLGVFGFGYVEDLDPLNALYLTVITMSTVGYGDVTPTNPVGKVLAMLVVLGGVSSFVGVVETVVENVFSIKEKRAKRQKRNMIRGVLFADLGQALLREIAAADPKARELGEKLAIDAAWTEEMFSKKRKYLEGIVFTVDPKRLDLPRLRAMLEPKSDLLLRLIENPSVVEAEQFADLLQALYHLRDELMSRPTDPDNPMVLAALPEADRLHLAGDVQRVYAMLARQWLVYVQYLKRRYAFLYSLAVRKNPFNPEASVVIQT